MHLAAQPSQLRGPGPTIMHIPLTSDEVAALRLAATLSGASPAAFARSAILRAIQDALDNAEPVTIPLPDEPPCILRLHAE